jgi:hypothetical protein
MVCSCVGPRIYASAFLTVILLFIAGAGLSNKEVLQAVLSGSRLPPIAQCPRAFHDLMTSCWQDAPKMRPTITDVHRRIVAITNGLVSGSTDADLGLVGAADVI